MVAACHDFQCSIVRLTMIGESHGDDPHVSGSFIDGNGLRGGETGVEVGNINSVMDGNIDGFITAYLKLVSEA